MAAKYGITDADIRLPGGGAYPGKLEGKQLAIYFSAHWCPPCRMFTPKLTEWYTQHKSDRFELIFVSSDRDVHAYEEYANSMSFPALKYEDRKLKELLAREFGVQGIPTLVVVDADGSIITKNGREGVMLAPESFPWRPKSLKQIITDGKLLAPDGKTVDDVEAHLRGKAVAIYFSASWCGPCKRFSPVLADCYKSLREAGKGFEVVFVSSDRDEASFKEYFGHMPWLAVPFGDPRIELLSSHFEVEGIPTIVMVDGTSFRVLSKDIRQDVMEDPKGARFPWKPEAVVELAPRFMSHINDVPSFIVFAGRSSFAELRETLTPVAARLLDEADRAGEAEAKIRFAVASDDSELTETLRQFLGLSAKMDKSVDEVLLVDIRGQCKYVMKPGKVSADFAEKTVQDFVAGKLEGKRRVKD